MPTRKPDQNDGGLSREDITQLIEMISQKNIEEFELEQGGMRLRIVAQRGTQGAPVALVTPAPAAAPAPDATVVATSSTPSNAPEDDPNLKKVTSPMVGTFYRAASPGAKPFVEVGDKVDENTILCIIEAMKLMNEIKAEMRGVVKKILVDNAQPVEYGQALFLIEPS